MTGNRVALVTGANRGIGKEVARQLAQLGVTVLLGSRDPAAGVLAAKELAADGAEVTPVELDVAEVASVEALAGRVRDEYGRLDILVNNAGMIIGAPATDTTAVDLRPMFEVNVFGVVTVVQTLLPLIRASAAPSIVNVSSTTASMTLTHNGADLPGDAGQRLGYTSSKAALNMLTVQYAAAFSRDPELRHIRINSASPGYTATDMNHHRGLRHVSDGARIIVDLAVRPDGRTGEFLHDFGAIPW